MAELSSDRVLGRDAKTYSEVTINRAVSGHGHQSTPIYTTDTTNTPLARSLSHAQLRQFAPDYSTENRSCLTLPARGTSPANGLVGRGSGFPNKYASIPAMGLLVLIAAYLLGGLTFIPLVLWVGIVVGTRKIEEGSDAVHGIGEDEGDKKVGDGTKNGTKNNLDADWGVEGLEDIQMGVLDGLKRRTHVPDVAAGYFAVCREYVPGGINGKPPERTTPAGSVIATESPSVYQSMYRSIFDRNKSFTPTLDGANGKSKRARNIFYVVLRYVEESDSTRNSTPKLYMLEADTRKGLGISCSTMILSN